MRPQVNIILLGERFSPYDAEPWPTEVRLTLVVSGSRRSGKSTILKQMNLRWSRNLCDVEERKGMRQVIFSNMISAFNVVITKMHHAGIKYRREESSVRQNFIHSSLSNDNERSVATRQICQACCRYGFRKNYATDLSVRNGEVVGRRGCENSLELGKSIRTL